MSSEISEARARFSAVGPHGPAVGTPARRPASVRRTTTHDSERRDGPQGPVTVTALGRDLYTGEDDSATVLGAVRLSAVAGFPGYALAGVSADPADGRLAALDGARASSGFRRRVEQALPGERDAGTLLHQLLDDLPTALLVSGYAVLAGAVLSPAAAGLAPRTGPLQKADMCSGWVTGGVMVAGLERGVPPYSSGPPAPALASADPLGWHAFPAARPSMTRRHRRLDVWATAHGHAAESFFRDSYVRPDGTETVIHEYTVRAQLATRGGDAFFTSCEAEFGALPWPECPGALASAGRLAGTPVAGLRSRVREQFYGVGTCTHLNDTLRALADVGALIGTLVERQQA